MYYISDYKKRAIDKIIPYLIEFPQVVKIIENSADRYQAIENLLWNIANNFKIDDARGIFLDIHAHNEVVDIIYTDKAQDAFTYGADKPMYQAYGSGHYYSQASYISGIKKDISEDKLIRAIKAKIIQNNTNGNIEDFIESLKLYFNATKVSIFESNPLNISLMLSGNKLELSSSGNREIIKQMLPACVKLGDIFVDTYNFDIFQYSENSSYGDSRYPVLVGETTDIYSYISLSVNLNSANEEYVETKHANFEEGMFACIAGNITKVNNNSTFISSNNIEEDLGFSLNIYNDGEKDLFAINYNNVIYQSNIEAEENKNYTILLYNSGTSLQVWVLKDIQINGKTSNQDLSFISNRILNSTPDIEVTEYTTIDAPIYINCINTSNGKVNFGDFTYYAIIFGSINNNTKVSNITEYYTSCFGEKQILFNCIENKNHLYIHTIDPLVSNILIKQPYFNYKATHSNGKYVYMDGKSGIDYFIHDNIQYYDLHDFNIKFDICMPIEISTGNIISDFVGDIEGESSISFEKDGKLSIQLPIYKVEVSTDETGAEIETETKDIIKIYTEENIIQPNEYASFEIIYTPALVEIYKNGVKILNNELDNTIIKNSSTTLRVGYDKNITNPYKGFIKNVYVNIIGIDENGETETDFTYYPTEINLPYKSKLQDSDKKYEYVNYGARFITTPQLIDDNTNLDLFGNALIGRR